MKMKSILAVALVLVGSAVFANDANDNKLAVISGKESGIFKVIYEGESFVRATVSVLDKSGNVVFDQVIKGQNGFILPMNFTGLNSGEYTISVKHGEKSWTKTINYTEAAPVAKFSSIENVHVAKVNNGKYLVSITTGKEQFVRVNIFDINNELLHSDIRKTDGNYAVIYDVKGATGEVKFQITDKNGYSKVVKK